MLVDTQVSSPTSITTLRSSKQPSRYTARPDMAHDLDVVVLVGPQSEIVASNEAKMWTSLHLRQFSVEQCSRGNLCRVQTDK